MIHSDQLWKVIQGVLPRDRWLPLGQLYPRIEARVTLDREDFLPSAPTNDEPKWKRNVRNVLQQQKATGKVLWNGHGSYRLPGAA